MESPDINNINTNETKQHLRHLVDEAILTITTKILTNYLSSLLLNLNINLDKNPTSSSSSSSFTKYIFLANFLRSEESLLTSPSYAYASPSANSNCILTPNANAISTIHKNPSIFPHHTHFLTILKTLGITITDWNLIRYLKYYDPLLFGCRHRYKHKYKYNYRYDGIKDGKDGYIDYEKEVEKCLELLPPPTDAECTEGVLRLARIAMKFEGYSDTSRLEQA
ncbi:hypothetical protein AOL_s00078g452 [Orbilia oligospora ATCC 24927]|uniref:Uncharacterized protein n=1 Tax=Arthrobotrys oligospora (strain ATCC 24927 / CBS 115.81 / DSM 1491) TaxID=756982 RepID=G1XC05_ARTOA|nr:hypothetical protein AOL_s00078g452 [Orbilia oligospora ATCC 24927]EGX49419.1 hypothetical protein AOL_s00078g452 [Orbilia oligospora ATCC 24927]